MGAATIGLTGRGGGRLREICDEAVCVPYDNTPDIQERHLPIYHAICIALEKEFFGQVCGGAEEATKETATSGNADSAATSSNA
jgi:hypothetical protein